MSIYIYNVNNNYIRVEYLYTAIIGIIIVI